jgi:putative transposase
VAQRRFVQTLRPEQPNHVLSYDFMSTFTHDGRTVRMLNLIDEFTWECLAIRPRRRLNKRSAIEVLAGVMIERGIPEHIRSNNGPEFVAQDLRKWLAAAGAKALYIEPGSPSENRYCERFNSRLRDEFLNLEFWRDTMPILRKTVIENCNLLNPMDIVYLFPS